MSKISAMLLAGAMAATAIAAPATATTYNPVNYTFDFTGAASTTTCTNPGGSAGSCSSTNFGSITAGNSISQTVGGITVTATAWSLDSTIGTGFGKTSGTASSLGLSAAKLVEYQGSSYGLGVTDKYEDGSAPYHTVDNSGAYDFIVLSFSRPVQLLGATLNPFQLTNNPADSDAWVSFSDVVGSGAPITNSSVFANMILHATEVLGGSSVPATNSCASPNGSTCVNPGMNTGYSWIIGADAFNDGNQGNDAFKLAGLTVQLPVPEPATWASMIFGLGLIGAVLRRRRWQETAAFA